MPTIMTIYGFRFFFYSREETRMHVHVEYQGYYQFELNKIQNLTRLHEKAFKKAWISHFG